MTADPGEATRMELLERARPLDDLARLMTEAASGHGRLALVGGEAGIGKTTLPRRFTRALPGRGRGTGPPSK